MTSDARLAAAMHAREQMRYWDEQAAQAGRHGLALLREGRDAEADLALDCSDVFSALARKHQDFITNLCQMAVA